MRELIVTNPLLIFIGMGIGLLLGYFLIPRSSINELSDDEKSELVWQMESGWKQKVIDERINNAVQSELKKGAYRKLGDECSKMGGEVNFDYGKNDCEIKKNGEIVTFKIDDTKTKWVWVMTKPFPEYVPSK